jgi:uroporphyrinogen decarboxylase
MKSLSNVERLEAIVNGEQPDRIPVHDLACITIAQVMGYMWKDVRYEPEKCAKITDEYNKLAGSDFCFGMLETPAMFMDLGMEITQPDDNYGSVMSVYYKEPEDVDRLELYDPMNPKESKWLRKGIIDKILEYRKVNSTGALTSGWSWGAMTTAGFLLGVENLMMYTMTEPELAMKAIEKAKSLTYDVMRAGQEGGECIWLPDPTASGSMMDIATFRDFVEGPTSEIIHKWRKEFHVPIIYHICGDTIPIMPAIPATGLDILSVDTIVDLKSAREIVGQTISLMGNVNPITTVWNGSNPEVIKAEAYKCINAAGADGRFILAAGCEVPKDTPIENIQALVMAAKSYRF